MQTEIPLKPGRKIIWGDWHKGPLRSTEHWKKFWLSSGKTQVKLRIKLSQYHSKTQQLLSLHITHRENSGNTIPKLSLYSAHAILRWNSLNKTQAKLTQNPLSTQLMQYSDGTNTKKIMQNQGNTRFLLRPPNELTQLSYLTRSREYYPTKCVSNFKKWPLY